VGATDIDVHGTLLLVDLATRTVAAELPPPAGPMGVGITPDGNTAFTADHGDTEGKTLSVIDLGTRTIVESIPIAGSPEETAIREDGKLGVVNTDGDESVRFFDPRDPSHTMSAPLLVGGDPGGSAFVASEKKVVIAQSLTNGTGKAGYSVIDISDENAPKVVESVSLPGVPYGTDAIPGTTHVLVTAGVTVCTLSEIDVSTAPSALVRTIALPCGKASLPLSTAVDREGAHAFVGVPGDNSLMVVDLVSGRATRIPWLEKAGPMHVALTR
jgi:DNA-binding beta-propeller fold protein YncE